MIPVAVRGGTAGQRGTRQAQMLGCQSENRRSPTTRWDPDGRLPVAVGATRARRVGGGRCVASAAGAPADGASLPPALCHGHMPDCASGGLGERLREAQGAQQPEEFGVPGGGDPEGCRGPLPVPCSAQASARSHPREGCGNADSGVTTAGVSPRAFPGPHAGSNLVGNGPRAGQGPRVTA